MKLITPDYYRQFRCIAQDCAHSCCVGWEIDIDPVTYEKYMEIPGELGKRLAESIDLQDGQASFRLTEDERCPFLNKTGLCDIISALGEEELCRICADHPRFRNFFSDRTELGLGLCCHAAGELILSLESKAQLIVTEYDGIEEALTAEEKELLDIRTGALALAQNRALPLEARLCQILDMCGARPLQFDPRRWAGIFRGLERLDTSWDCCLDRLWETGGALALPSGKYHIPGEQLLVYFIFRHFPGAIEDGRLPERAAFSALSFYTISALWALEHQASGQLSIRDMAETARLYSGEIEYSDENLNSLLEVL